MTDFKIKKIEKGPLQRFKNQNMILKKFGEVGITVYKGITGKRTVSELKKDLGVEERLFDQMINYMNDAGMIELVGNEETEQKTETAIEATPTETVEEETPSPKIEKKSRTRKKAQIEPVAIEPTFEEPPPPITQKKEETPEYDDTIKPIEPEFDFDSKTEKKMEKKRIDETDVGDEIKPIEFDTSPQKSPPEIESIQEESPPNDIPPEPEIAPYEQPIQNQPSLSPVEKIIYDKYGDVGLRVYALIDGQRTAEEIMKDTGLTEAKLVEMLDFMDEQGIIKLDYPKGQPPPATPTNAPPFNQQYAPPQQPQNPFNNNPTMAPPPAPPKADGSFNPMLDNESSLDDSGPVPFPLDLPIKAPIDIVKSVQLKAKVLLKYGDKGTKLVDMIDGKNDVLDLSLKLDQPLYIIYDMVKFLTENGFVLLRQMARPDVRKKYGDDGYSVYKRYGREGLMLYELIGKDMTIKQMADKITRDKSKIVDMFVFIHQVLGIELPLDKNALSKQLQ
ncbi:MAG: hypothetical protein ACP5N9_06130 [Candidatus Bilamarchaeum sp.]|jgi:hypothetical protein